MREIISPGNERRKERRKGQKSSPKGRWVGQNNVAYVGLKRKSEKMLNWGNAKSTITLIRGKIRDYRVNENTKKKRICFC